MQGLQKGVDTIRIFYQMENAKLIRMETVL